MWMTSSTFEMKARTPYRTQQWLCPVAPGPRERSKSTWRDRLHCETVVRSRRAKTEESRFEPELEAALVTALEEERRRTLKEAAEKLWQDAASFDDDFDHDADHRSGFVALIGLPNVGKSTLLNSLLGQKLSIVTQKAQTTRQRVFGILSGDDYQVVLLDNPGLLTRTQHRLHERMMSFIRRSVSESDAMLILIDATDAPKQDLEMIQLPENWQGPAVGVVLNKVDLINEASVQEIKDWYVQNCRCKKVFLTNAKLGEGVEDVKDWLVEQLPLGPPLYSKDDISQQSERFFISEIVREHIFLRYEDEIPYSIQVNVMDYKERPGNKDYISVDIVTERPNQKAILLGKKGTAVKALGLAARREIERFIERPVYLELNVSVVKGWRKNQQLLDSYGYQ